MSITGLALKHAANRGYYVSPDGAVISSRGRKLCTNVQRGYHYISVKWRGKSRTVAVARLQAYQKFGDRIFEPGLQVRHLDGNPGNNTADNVAIGTILENALDKPKHVRVRSARQMVLARRKFTDSEVSEMRIARVNGMTLAALAQKYGGSVGNMCNIVNGKRYIYTREDLEASWDGCRSVTSIKRKV